MLEVSSKHKINIQKNLVLKALNNLFKDRMYFIVLIIIFIKSILFTGLLGTNQASGINISKGFFSVPPFLVYLSFVMIILSVSFLFKGRGHLRALIIIDVIATLLFIGDAWYYRDYSGFLNFFLLEKKFSYDDIINFIITRARPIDIIFIIDIVPLTLYVIHNKELYRGVKRSIALFLVTLVLPVTYMGYVHFKVDVIKRCFYGQTVFLQSWAPTQTMSNLGPIGYHIYDAYVYHKNSSPYILSEKDKEDIKAWYDKNIEDLSDNKYAGMFKGKNLLIIQVESLENFVINQVVQGQEITPNLNKLLKNSLYFNNYHENVNNGISADSDLITNTGLYPVLQGSTFFRYPNNSYEHSLPNVLKEQGYSTIAFHPDLGSYWNWVPALQSIGFDRCIDVSGFNIKEPIGLGISDKEYMLQAASMIENEKEPFYTFMTTQTSHGPFDLPEKYRDMKLDEELDKTIMGDYIQSIHYTDEAIGQFLQKLDKEGILENTIVVIYGDHTGIHKFYKDKVDELKLTENWWNNNDMRIPLIIYNPSVKGEVFEIQSGQIDIMPTIEYLMGIDEQKYQRNTLGKVLVNTNKKYTILQSHQMYGEYTSEDQRHAIDGILLSDKMIRSNYFNKD